MSIPLRPHHLLCTLSYSGHGYSAEFTARMDALVARLRSICGDCEWRELCSAGDMLKNLG